MVDQVQDVLTYTLFPMVSIIVGGWLATWRPPSTAVQSMIQHFAAGVVFAAVAAELLPEALGEEQPAALAIGFAIGVAAMLLLKQVTDRLGPAEEEASGSAKRLIASVGVNVIVDGLLIGVAVAAGSTTGALITIALTIEVLFLGLTVSVAMLNEGTSQANVLVTSAGLALLLGVGAVLGVVLFGDLTGAAYVAVLAFAMASLLYLVTEELLTEAHELEETTVGTAMFFVGFLLLLMIETI